MDIAEISKNAFRNIAGARFRSALTMLGIIIGVASVIMITSVGGGLQKMVMQAFDRMGYSALSVSPNYSQTILNSDRLTLSDIKLAKEHTGIEYAAPIWGSSARVRLKNPSQTQRFSILATNEEYLFLRNVEIVYGRFISALDMDRRARVCVIDRELAIRIFGRADAVGEIITADLRNGSAQFTVIGITKSGDLNSLLYYYPIIFMPVTTVHELYNTRFIDSYCIKVADTADIDRVAADISRLLEVTHNNKNKYRIEKVLPEMDILDTVFRSVTVFVGVVAAISLLVGGIGVMNIMLVTVTERTREIGIRKAIGATRRDITFQFLAEAVILTATGGVLGIILGFYGGSSLGGLIRINTVVSVPMIILAVCVSSLTGVVFGVYPAKKAAMMNPIDALRHE